MSISEHPYLQSTTAVFPRTSYLPVWGCFVASTATGFDSFLLFFLFLFGGGGFLKEKVLFHRLQDTEGLKARIRQEVLRGVMDIFRTDCSSALQIRVCAYGHNF